MMKKRKQIRIFMKYLLLALLSLTMIACCNNAPEAAVPTSFLPGLRYLFAGTELYLDKTGTYDLTYGKLSDSNVPIGTSGEYDDLNPGKTIGRVCFRVISANFSPNNIGQCVSYTYIVSLNVVILSDETLDADWCYSHSNTGQILEL